MLATCTYVASLLNIMDIRFRLDQIFSDAFASDHQLLKADPKRSLWVAVHMCVSGEGGSEGEGVRERERGREGEREKKREGEREREREGGRVTAWEWVKVANWLKTTWACVWMYVPKSYNHEMSLILAAILPVPWCWGERSMYRMSAGILSVFSHHCVLSTGTSRDGKQGSAQSRPLDRYLLYNIILS